VFRALVVDKDADGRTSAAVRTLDESQLPAGDVTVRIACSTLNYKDGLCLGAGGGLVRTWPHVPGIDFAGEVEASDDPRYRPGDAVILTGWRVGENRWGGYAEKARVPADFLVPLPEGLTPVRAMAIGTAGLAAMLAVEALEQSGLAAPAQRPVLVTGAAGGVGSLAIMLLTALGFEVAAVTGRPEAASDLERLGASRIVPRADIEAAVPRPLESETWSGCVDAVGGAMLSRVLKQLQYGGAAAAVGLAGGADVPLSIVPFVLRAVRLIGIDSVMQPFESRVRAWRRLADLLPMDRLDAATSHAGLADLPRLGRAILAGEVRGRIVIDVNA
jgi:acrylyl-CoA reductase (NADPH)